MKPRYPDYLHGLSGEIRLNEPMSRHTTWRVGGVAEVFFTPADLADLQVLCAQLPDTVPLTWLGLGSNLLVRDGGLRGVVVRLHKAINQMEKADDTTLYAEAGVSSAQLAKYAGQQGLDGAAFLGGIPGTLGGALAMNAGAFGHEIWPLVKRVRVLTPTADLVWRSPEDFEIRYRHVAFKRAEDQGGGFIAAELGLVPTHSQSADSKTNARAQIRALLARRAAAQPVQTANAGSVFKNPEGDHAARLLEAAGMKGVEVGDAEYSRKHANFIVNRGQATARDIEQLIKLGQEAVRQTSGVELVPEVRIIGEARR